MPISVRCVCDKTLKVADRLAGKSVKCPSCGTALSVPDQELPDDPGFEVVEEEKPVATLARAKPVSQRPHYAEDDERELPRRRPRNDENDDEDEYEERPRRRKRKSKETEHSGWFGTEKWILSSGVIGGLIAIAIAVVWFVLGLMANRIFFYPPILFIIGLVGIAKGMMSRGED